MAQNSINFDGSDLFITASELDKQFLLDLLECSMGGRDAQQSVEYVMENYDITGNKEDCIKYLTVYGAWEFNEMQCHETNLERLIWITAGGLEEDEREAYFSVY